MATVQRSQRLLLIAKNTEIVDYYGMAEAENCCAIIRGVPSELQARAIAESWTFPRVVIETWNEEVPDAPSPTDAGG